MAGPEGLRKKTAVELRAELRQAIAQVGGESVPPKGEEREFLKLSEEEIKEKYPRRSEIYQSLLNGEVGDSNAWFGNSKKGVPLGSLDIMRMKKWLHALNNLDTYIRDHESGDSVTLKDRQATVFEDMRTFVEKGGSSGYVKLPTGTGKTVLFAEFVEALDLRTLIVVPTKLLVDQTEERLKQFAPELDVGVVRSGRTRDLSRQCTVITYESLVRKLASEEIHSTDYDCLILDEAHVGLSDTRKSAIEQFSNTLKIGFTATPDFSATKGVSQLLGTEIHRMSIKEAVQDEGLLSGFQCILAKTETDLSKVKVIGGEKYDEKELEQAVNNLARNQAAVDLYGQMFKGEMAIAYCAGIQHATDLAQMFKDAGVSADVISGKTSEKERVDILRRYDEGEIKVLCNSDLLIAGFDQPKAAVCLNLRPTLSAVVAEQRGGRVLRVNEADEEKVAYIVDFVDKGHNPKHYPTLFAEVAEETALLRRGKLGRARYKKLEVKVEGLEVETESANVADFVKEIRKERGVPQEKEIKWPYEKLKQIIRDRKITGPTYYLKLAKQNKWPDLHAIKAQSDFVSWDDFFGRDDIETLRRKVIDARVDSTGKYEAEAPKRGWPNRTTVSRMKGFTTWSEFFGRWNYNSLQTVAKNADITTFAEYGRWRTAHPELKLPVQATIEGYSEFIDADTFFEKERWTYSRLRDEIRKYSRQIQGMKDYLRVSKKEKWPGRRVVTKFAEFVTWEELLRR